MHWKFSCNLHLHFSGSQAGLPEGYEAPVSSYLALVAHLSLSNGVLVHSGAYGHDFSLLFDALAGHPQLRAVLARRRDTVPHPKVLKGLCDEGVRAACFRHHSSAGARHGGAARQLQAQDGQRRAGPARSSFAMRRRFTAEADQVAGRQRPGAAASGDREARPPRPSGRSRSCQTLSSSVRSSSGA